MKLIDLKGKKFGKWKALKRVENDKSNNTRWWCKCECGRERIVRAGDLRDGSSTQCANCAGVKTSTGRFGPNNNHYKGGWINTKGYRMINVNGKPILEHRYVIERLLKRKLKSWEVPHHINCVKTDNRPENLQLITLAQNSSLHAKIRREELRTKKKFLYEHEKKGILDIEASSLVASFGIVLCWAIMDADNGKVSSALITPEDLKSESLDKRVLEELLDTLPKFDRVIGYYSKRYDLPFLRSRCLIHGLSFPEAGELLHDDLYFTVRYRLKLHNNKLDTVLRALFKRSQKTHLLPGVWLRAIQGDREALDYVMRHNIMDVKETRKLWKILKYQKAITNRGI